MSQWLEKWALASGAVLALACGSPPRARSCGSDSDCATGQVCRSAVCAVDPGAATPGNALTMAAASESFRANQPIRFHAVGSTAAGEVVEYRWSVDRLRGPVCEVEERLKGGPDYEVVFFCAGDYEIWLVGVYAGGAVSAPVSVRIQVQDGTAEPLPPPPALIPPVITADPDLEVAHLCSGDPLRCALRAAGDVETVQLGASAAASDGGPVTFAWSCAAPALEPAPRITVAGAATSAPLLHVETDATAIAGEYVCTVVATDSAGASATAYQKVTVTNEPPIATAAAGPILVGHSFGILYRAAGSTPVVTVVDPENDPIAGSYAGRATGTSGTLHVIGLGAIADFEVTAGQPGELIGTGVSRAITYSAVDVNGGGANLVEWEVVVTNRPPRWVSSGGSPTVGHGFESGKYTASAALGTFVDDDGDPVTASTTGSSLCELGVAGDRGHADCALPYTTPGDLAAFATLHSLAVRVRDPWSDSLADQVSLRITNQKPVVLTGPFRVPTSVVYGSVCCDYDYDIHKCLAFKGYNTGGSAALLLAVDPEGDPVTVMASGINATATPVTTCTPWSCPGTTVTLAPTAPACDAVRDPASLTVRASDGQLFTTDVTVGVSP